MTMINQTDKTHKANMRHAVLFGGGVCLLAAAFALSISLGSVKISLGEIIDCFFSADKVQSSRYSIIMNIRLPRTLAAIAGGAALAASGVLLQNFFGNPIVEPYILGISSGSNLFLGLVILGGYSFGLGSIGSMGMFLGSFAGAMAVMLMVVFVSRKVRSVTSLLIIGLMLGYVCSAVTGILTAIADKERIMGFSRMTMGSFSGFTWEQLRIMCPIIAIFLILAFLLSKNLNAMLLGERYAQSMGVSVRSFRIAVVTISSVLTAAVTAFAGAVSFIGLAVPHIVRIIFKTSDHRIVIPASVIYGAVMACLCDMGARLIMPPTELPLGSMTTIIGAPIAVYLLVRKNGGDL